MATILSKNITREITNQTIDGRPILVTLSPEGNEIIIKPKGLGAAKALEVPIMDVFLTFSTHKLHFGGTPVTVEEITPEGGSPEEHAWESGYDQGQRDLRTMLSAPKDKKMFDIVRENLVSTLNLMQQNGMIEGYGDSNPPPTEEELDELAKELCSKWSATNV
tara:strand:- start:10 stop:498 length:489 start_codon:yes stop_codon:yes gene_type:complete